MKKKLISILAGVLLTAFFYLFGALFSGGGHDLSTITCFFPYGMTTGLLLEDTSLEFIGKLLFILQFPLYALVYANVKNSGRRWIVLSILLISHITVAAVGLNVHRASKWQSYTGISSG